jgi:hypothetical protein
VSERKIERNLEKMCKIEQNGLGDHAGTESVVKQKCSV